MAAFRGEEQSPRCGRRGLGYASCPTFEAWMRLPGREAPAWGRSKSSVGFSKTIPIPCGLSPFVGTATEKDGAADRSGPRSEEHTSELQSRGHLVCRLLLEKKKKN